MSARAAKGRPGGEAGGGGKTFALGIARHAWQLDGYGLLATASSQVSPLPQSCPATFDFLCE
jgi:hypothetical protein